MDVLISIKPKYVEKILSGEKTIELRKRYFKTVPRRIYIYSSAPTQRIVAYFYSQGLFKAPIQDLWNEVGFLTGVLKKEFFEYYEGKEEGFGIEISDLVKINPINPKDIEPNFTPPQSFKYLEEGLTTVILKP